MLIKRAYKYELKPNNKQIGLLIRYCGVSRFAWNWALARRIELYNNNTGKQQFTFAMDQHRELVVLKKTEFSWMYEVSKSVPQESLRDLDKAYDDMFKRIKNREKKIGRPKFKKKGKHDKFTLNGRIKINENSIKFPKLGLIRIKESSYKFKGRILSATVKREADRWYCSLCVEVDIPNPIQIIGDVVGIDLGLDSFAVIYNGNKFNKVYAPKPLKIKLRRLQRLSQKQSRKKRGSHNRKKCNLALAILHHHIKNTRKDFLNKLTTSLAKNKSVVIIEDLAVSNMKRNRHLARSISDVGWGDFRRQLNYKTTWYGSRLVLIPRFEPSSKRCSSCGEINQSLELSDREWVCNACGAIHDRDQNASINIRNCGISILNTESSSGIKACGVGVSPPILEADHVEAGSKQVYNDYKTYGTGVYAADII